MNAPANRIRASSLAGTPPAVSSVRFPSDSLWPPTEDPVKIWTNALPDDTLASTDASTCRDRIDARVRKDTGRMAKDASTKTSVRFVLVGSLFCFL